MRTRAARLEVLPALDVMMRIFMLFRGVAAEDAGHQRWAAAHARVGEVGRAGPGLSVWGRRLGMRPGARYWRWGAMGVW